MENWVTIVLSIISEEVYGRVFIFWEEVVSVLTDLELKMELETSQLG